MSIEPPLDLSPWAKTHPDKVHLHPLLFHTMSERRQREQARHRRSRLLVEQLHVEHTPVPDPAGRAGGLPVTFQPLPQAPKGSRLAAVEDLLGPLAASTGSAAVVCTTVTDAQDTYRYLSGRFQLGRTELVLLHARLPGEDREDRTRKIVTRLGRRGTAMPNRFIVIATQVIEQSLDLDVDLMISDLAPIALLLQRAGRCWRHELAWLTECGCSRRPPWAPMPRLVVLESLGRTGTPPPHGGKVYPPYLLSATRNLLADRAVTHPAGPAALCAGSDSCLIDVPDDVQDLVERVHGRDSYFSQETANAEREMSLAAQRLEHEGTVLAQRHLGQLAAVPAVGHASFLKQLFGAPQDEVTVATRLGADAVRVLCCYRQPGASRPTLDPEGTRSLPEVGPKGQLHLKDAEAVMHRTFPINQEWLADCDSDQDPPSDWSEHPVLGELALLVHEVRDGEVLPVPAGDHSLFLHPDLGLIRRPTQ